jgi:recombination protein RecA
VTGLLGGSQAAGEPCAWVGSRGSVFFPPDLARSGVDLEALAVVFVRSSAEAGRATARLLRSGAFGLVVVDLGGEGALSASVEGRLSGLAREHDAAVVLLTDKEADRPSAGAMVSMRVEAKRARVGEARFTVRVEALKDKRRGPGWSAEEVVGGPAGLR